MGALLSRLSVFLVGLFTAVFGSWKSVLLVTGLAFLAIGLYNLVCEIIQETLTFALNQIGNIASPEGGGAGISITGAGGWLLTQLRFPECVAFVISCVSIKFIARKIPFIKW